MALSDLISRLEQEAKSQVQAIEQQADAEVHAIEVATERAIADLTTRHLEHERAERQTVDQRGLALARQQARARELDARHAQITRILERARVILSQAASSASYGNALPSHVHEALSFLEGLRPRVRCPSAFAPLLQTTIARHDGAELVIDDSLGPGVVAEAADGSLTVDDTLAARLVRAEPRLAIELSRKLGDAGQ